MIDTKGFALPKPGRKRGSLRYRMMPGYRIYPDGREVCANTPLGRGEYKWRTRLMWLRQGRLCAITGHTMRSTDATFDHEDTRGMGGGLRDDRITVTDPATGNTRRKNAAVCAFHNAEKGSRRVPYKFQ